MHVASMLPPPVEYPSLAGDPASTAEADLLLNLHFTYFPDRDYIIVTTFLLSAATGSISGYTRCLPQASQRPVKSSLS